MVWLAVTTLEKLQSVPRRFWVNASLVILGGLLAILLVRHAVRMNKLVLSLIIFLFVTVVCFQWIYERNEPRLLTPYVNKVAPFFPSKLEYRGHD